MSEIRSTLFPDGACANQQSQLFDRLDEGRGTVDDIALAKEACATCPQFIDCLSGIGSTALNLYQHGIETGVIGGLDFDRQSLDNLNIEGFGLLTEMHIDFLSPHTTLKAIRQLMLTGQKTHFVRGLSMSVPPIAELEGHEAYALLPPELGLRAQKTLSWAFRFTRDYLKIDHLPSWNEIPERKRFDALAETYLPEVVTLQHMQITDPAWSALLLSSDEYRQIQAQYSHLGSQILRAAYNKTDCKERLERASQRMNWAKHYYADNPLIGINQIKITIASSIASDDELFESKLAAYADKQRYKVAAEEMKTQIIEERIKLAGVHYQNEPYVTLGLIRRHALQTGSDTVQDLMDRLEAHVQRCKNIEEFTLSRLNTTNNMSRFILHFAGRENGVEKAREALDDLLALAKKYSINSQRLARCLQKYKPTISNIESKFLRYKQNLRMLAPLRYEPSISNTYLDYCAFYRGYDPVREIKGYYERLDLLQRTFRDDEDFDDLAFQKIATRASKDIIREAHKYKDTYYKLRAKYEHDAVEDWMVRAGAASYKDPDGKLYRLRLALRLGYLQLYLDAPLASGTSSTYHSVIGNSQNPEDDYIQQENFLGQRVRISGAITSLVPLERQALCAVFGLDWLAEDTTLDTEDICSQLGIEPTDLETYVQQVIIPKIDAEKLKGL